MAQRDHVIRTLIDELPDTDMCALADRLIRAAGERGPGMADSMAAQALASALAITVRRHRDPLEALHATITALLAEMRRNGGATATEPFPSFVAQLANCAIGEILLVTDDRLRLDLVYRMATAITEAVEVRSGVWPVPPNAGTPG